MLLSSSTDSAQTSALVAVTLKTLVDLAKPALALNLRQASIRSAQGGGYVSPFKGRGMEFDEARLYQPGDDIRSIDWRVTARTGKAHTKLFREERERPVFIAVDNRPTMHFATRGVFKSVLAAKLAGLLAWTAQQHGDRIGGQIFSEHECRELKPQNGKHAVLRFFNALVRPEQLTENSFTLEHVLARLTQHARPGSRVYIISDFRGFNDKAEKHLARLAQHCDVILIMIHDALEKALPETGRYRFTDGARDVLIDSADRRRLSNYQQRFALHQQHLQTLAKKMGLALIQCSTSDDPIECLRNAR